MQHLKLVIGKRYSFRNRLYEADNIYIVNDDLGEVLLEKEDESGTRYFALATKKDIAAGDPKTAEVQSAHAAETKTPTVTKKATKKVGKRASKPTLAGVEGLDGPDGSDDKNDKGDDDGDDSADTGNKDGAPVEV